jgi:hypothetical protein
MIDTKIASGAKKLAPLVSFNALIDTDVGLIKLIYKEYLNPTTFDVSFFRQDIKSIILQLYRRKTLNPLLLFALNKNDVETLDSYYQEFFEKRRKDIYKLSVNTEVMSMISYLNESNESNTSILYYNDEQLEILMDEPTLVKNKKVDFNNLILEEKESYSQFFFKTIEEARDFDALRYKTFYFPRAGYNLNDANNDLKDSEIITNIVTSRNQINIYDLYNIQKLTFGKE